MKDYKYMIIDDEKISCKSSYILHIDGCYVAYEPITLPCILFMFFQMNFIHCHSYVIFAIKSMGICND